MARYAGGTSEITFPLLAFHCGFFVAVDQPALSLGMARIAQFGDDLGQRGSGRFDGAGQRVASQGAEADAPQMGPLAGLQRQTIVVDHDPNLTAADYRARFGEVERYDGNSFCCDVFPDVQLGPVGQREHAHRLPPAQTGVVEPPEFRPLVFRVPAMVGTAHRKDPLLSAALFLVPTRPAERRVKSMAVER